MLRLIALALLPVVPAVVPVSGQPGARLEAVGNQEASAGEGEAAVTLVTLLDELVDRRTLSEFPRHSFRTLVASSRNPASVKAGAAGWFAEPDRGHFADEAKAGSGGERVLLEHEGPGALVRLWCDVPRGELRVYVDGASEPTLAGPLSSWVRGGQGLPAPLADVDGGTGVLILPVPFERGCKVTCVGAGELGYRLTYRAYEAGTPVESLRPDDFERHADALEAAARALGTLPDKAEGEAMHPFGHKIASTGSDGAAIYAGLSNDASARPSSISELRLVVRDAEPADGKDLSALLGEARLILTFDGVDTVAVPLLDFFALRGGLESFDSRYLSVRVGESSALLVARYLMPFRKRCFVRVESLCPEPLDVQGFVTFAPYEWTPNTLFFHAQSRHEPRLAVEAATDWSAFALEGRGQWVGDFDAYWAAESAATEAIAAWRDGDDKLYVDGETYPSSFGTGVADYFGARPERGPFTTVLQGCTSAGAKQPEGRPTWSHYRFRALDLVPFLARLELHRELPSPSAGGRAATAVYYADLAPEKD